MATKQSKKQSDKTEEQSNKTEKQKICFVTAPIGAEGSDTRIRSDKVLKYIIQSAIEPLGFSVVRADKIAKAGSISNHIIEYIIESDIVVADLTEKNPNVFYELAIRHCIHKPVIQLISKNEVIPFDVGTIRTIFYDINDIENVENVKNDIINQLKSFDTENVGVNTLIPQLVNLEELLRENEEKNTINFLQQLENTNKVLREISQGATPSLLQKLVDEGHLLIRLVDNTPYRSYYPYEVGEMRKSYYEICTELQRIVKECNGDVAHNHDNLRVYINNMWRTISILRTGGLAQAGQWLA
jgi:hypothetical protein